MHPVTLLLKHGASFILDRQLCITSWPHFLADRLLDQRILILIIPSASGKYSKSGDCPWLSPWRIFIDTALLWSCCQAERIPDNTQRFFTLDDPRPSWTPTKVIYKSSLRSLRTLPKPKSFFDSLETAFKFQQSPRSYFFWILVK